MDRSQNQKHRYRFKKPRFNCIYEGCSFQSTAIQAYLDHVDDSHDGIEPPMRARLTDDDPSLDTSTGKDVFPSFYRASPELDPPDYEDTTSVLPGPIQPTAGVQATDNTVDKWEDDMVDSDFASSDSESNASSTDEEDQVDNPGWQEDAGIRKRDTLGQWDEIYKVEAYPIVRAAGAPTNKANLNDISYSGRALDGSNPWAPFANAKDYDLAKWFVESGTNMVDIDSFFNRGLCGLPGSFSSSRDLRKLIHAMESRQKTPDWHHAIAKDAYGEPLDFYYRDPLECIKALLSQVHLSDTFVWAPERHYNARNERLYSEMHTADWWWDMQDKLDVHCTIVPVILGSDQAQLTSFNGDKALHPVYLQIGNIPSTTRCSLSQEGSILLALLPIPHKAKSLDNKTETCHNALLYHSVLNLVLSSLRETARDGVQLDCADGWTRRCFPILQTWIADFPEQCKLTLCKQNRCPRCIVPIRLRGEYLKDEHAATLAIRESRDVRRRIKEGEDVEDTLGVKPWQNALWYFPRVELYDLPRTDILHTFLLGMLDHIMNWTSAFLRKHHCLQLFDSIWRTFPPYPGFIVPTRTFLQVKQWQGDEFRSFAKVFVIAVALALRNPKTEIEREDFPTCLQCCRSLISFIQYARLPRHTPTTLRLMEEHLLRFHESKKVFLEFRAGVKARTEAAELGRDMRMEEKAKPPAPMSRTQKQVRQQLLSRNINEAEKLKKEELSNYDIPKLHACQHARRDIIRHGALGQYSTDFPERNHKLLKEGYAHSNKNNATVQILQYHARKRCLKVHELRLRFLARKGFFTMDTLEVLGLLSSQARQKLQRYHRQYRKRSKLQSDIPSAKEDPKFWSPVFSEDYTIFCHRRCFKGPSVKRHSGIPLQDVMRDWSIPDLSKAMAVYLQNWRISRSDPNATLRWLVPTNFGELETALILPYNTIRIPVADLGQESVHYHLLRSCRQWRGKGARNDWAWILDQSAPTGNDTNINSSSTLNGPLAGCVAAKILLLFKYRETELIPCSSIYTRRSRTHRLAMVEQYKAMNKGEVNGAGFVTVIQGSEAKGHMLTNRYIVNIKSILGAAHLVPEPGSSMKFWVNNFIDLETFNDIHCQSGPIPGPGISKLDTRQTNNRVRAPGRLEK